MEFVNGFRMTSHIWNGKNPFMFQTTNQESLIQYSTRFKKKWAATSPQIFWTTVGEAIKNHQYVWWFIPSIYGWLVVSTPLRNMSSSVGMMTFPIWWEKKKTCSKPPTSYCFDHSTVFQICRLALQHNAAAVATSASSRATWWEHVVLPSCQVWWLSNFNKVWKSLFVPSGNLTQLLKMTIEIVDVPTKHGDVP